MTNAVAVSGGNDTGRYALRKVYEDGQAYWISGYLLKDACNLDAVLLRDSIDGNTKKDAEMLNFPCVDCMVVLSKITGQQSEKAVIPSVSTTDNRIDEGIYGF